MEQEQLIPLSWSAPKKVQTRMGARVVRTAAATPEFWSVWGREKDALRASGYSVTKNKAGAWEVAHWSAETAEDKQKKEVARAASRATDAQIDIPVPPGCELMGFQKAGVAYAMGRESVLIADEMGLGKAQPLTAKILTPTGWKTMGDMKVGSAVVGADGREHRVIGVYPQGKRPVYRVSFSDGTSVECDIDHLWNVQDANRRLRGKGYVTKSLRDMLDAGVTYRNGTSKWRVPLMEAPDMISTKLSIPAYVLGVLIGDGYMTGSTVTFSAPASKQPILEKVRKLMGAERVSGPHGSDASPQYNILGLEHRNNDVLRFIRDLELDVKSKERFVPEVCFTASAEDRLELLRGLMDTDGSARKGRTTFHTTSPRLRDYVAQLVRSLGGVAIIREYDRNHEGKGLEWQVNVRLAKCPFSLSYKAKEWRAPDHIHGRYITSAGCVGDAEQQCIRVSAEDQLYVTDNYTVTHNTVQGISVLNVTKARRALVICPASLRLNWRKELVKWLTGSCTVLTVTKKLSLEFDDCFRGAFMFHDKERSDGSQERQLSVSATQSPIHHIMVRSDATSMEIGLHRQSHTTTPTEVMQEPIDQSRIALVDNYLNLGADHDRSFSINDTGAVSKDSRVGGQLEVVRRVVARNVQTGLLQTTTNARPRDTKVVSDARIGRTVIEHSFGGFNLTVAESRSGSSTSTHHSVLVINYDQLLSYREVLRSVTWDVLIIDESHYLKNDKAQRTAEVFGKKAKGESPALSPIPATKRVLLSGTPILNRPIEMFSLLHYLDPARWRSKHSFATRYCDAKHNGYGWDYSGSSNLEELQTILRETVMVRRLKKDVLTDLPAKRRQIIVIPANGASSAVSAENAAIVRHEAALAKAKAEVMLALAGGGNYKAAVTQLRAVTQAAFDELAKLRHDTALAKVPYIVEHLQNVTGKVIVMAHHYDVVDRLVTDLGPDLCVKLDGRDTLEDRQTSVDRFQNDEKVQFFIGTIKAAGVGITLTRSSHVVFAELDWVPGNMSQAEDRAHRIGQTDSVLIQHLVLDGSLDARMAHILVAKQDIIDRALDTPVAKRDAQEEPAIPFDWDAAMSRVQLDKETETLFVYRKPSRADKVNAKADALEDIVLPPEIVTATLKGLRLLTGLDSDRAMEKNDIGFNKVDSFIGHELGGRDDLTVKQAALARLVLRKYRRQLGSLYDSIFPH